MSDLVIQMLIKAETAGAVRAVQATSGAILRLKGDTELMADAAGRTAQATGVAAQGYQALRAALDPVFAASQRYEAALDAAQAAGVITDKDRARTLALVEAQMIDTRGMRALGAASGATKANLTNLTFQLQNVAMMASLGQVPLATMLQQGPQIAGVFGQMRESGPKIGPAVLGALRGLISPMSLLTLGAVGAAAVLVQWGMAAFFAGEEVKTADERMTDFTDAMSNFDASALLSKAGVAELRAEFGPLARRFAPCRNLPPARTPRLWSIPFVATCSICAARSTPSWAI